MPLPSIFTKRDSTPAGFGIFPRRLDTAIGWKPLTDSPVPAIPSGSDARKPCYVENNTSRRGLRLTLDWKCQKATPAASSLAGITGLLTLYAQALHLAGSLVPTITTIS